MNSLRRWRTRLRNSLAGRIDSQRFKEEIEEHIALETAENLRAGLPPDEARRQAILKFGGVEGIKEDYQAERAMQWIFLQDLRFSIRVLRKSPAFTIVTVGTLALGIAANAIVFSVMNALILHPLKVPQAESLYQLMRGKEAGTHSYPDYLDLRDRNRSFDELVAYDIAVAGIDTGGDPSSAWVAMVTGNYLYGQSFYSALSARIGSVDAARRAGTIAAIAAAIKSSSMLQPTASGSITDV